MIKKYFFLGVVVSILTACATTSQLTSGADYRARYKSPTLSSPSKIDQQVRDVASIEPDLSFPARIGLARIQKGRLVSIPSDEAGYWESVSANPNYGSFIPVSPLIADMVTSSHALDSVVEHIRLGSARQHLDYVMIYEVTQVSDRKSNALRLADLTVLGLFVLPSRNVKIENTASAMLIDVRNGYPYGSATAFVEKSSVATLAGSSSRKDKLSQTTKNQAVESLTSEVQVFMEELYAQIQSQ